MGEITIASTSDTPNQVREALGLPAVADTPDPGQNPFVASAEIKTVDKVETITDTSLVAEPVETPVETAAPKEDAYGDEGPDDEAASEAGRILADKRSAKGRIDRMRYEQAELKEKLSAKDAETAELRARLEALESGKLTVTPRPPEPEPKATAAPVVGEPFNEPRPTSDDFTDYDEFEKAKDDWLVRKINHERDLKEAAAEARRQAAAEEARRQAAIDNGIREQQAKWEEQRTKAKERFPDFDEVFASAKDLPVHPSAVVALQHSERGAELTYYLATHPEEAERINKLPPGAIWTELGKLEVKLELGLIGAPSDAPATEARPVSLAGRVPVSQAPPPMTRVGAGGAVRSTTKDPDKMNHAEFKAWRAAGGGT